MFYLKDPKTGQLSVTLTLLISTFAIALIKVLLAGITINNFSFGEFTGTDFAAMIGAVGAIYGFRKHTDKGKTNENNN